MAGTPGLVDGEPIFNPVTKVAGNHTSVLSKGIHCRSIQPGIFQRGRQIPMIEGCHGCDPGFQQTVHQPAVEIQPGRVDPAPTFRQNTRPTKRKTVIWITQRLHDLDVFLPTMVVVAGDISGITIQDFSWCMRKDIPNGFALAIFVDCPFNLIRSSGCSPHEVIRKFQKCCHGFFIFLSVELLKSIF